jgi:pimeloyl-ACP methyl ester carboxylesterase
VTSFVFVHGSGQNASCWARLGAVLQDRGHAVSAPDLPKHARDWELEDHAALIADAVPDEDAVVVAHSLSGVFLPLVASMCECSLLVFLAAVIPEPGKSIRAQFTEDASMFSPEWIAAGPRWFDRSQQESLAREFLFHDCDASTIDWALGTLEPYETEHLVSQALAFDEWTDASVASIVATEDRTLSPDWIRRTSPRVLKQDAIEIPGGHCPHVSRPADLAQLLERLAAGESA